MKIKEQAQELASLLGATSPQTQISPQPSTNQVVDDPTEELAPEPAFDFNYEKVRKFYQKKAREEVKKIVKVVIAGDELKDDSFLSFVSDKMNQDSEQLAHLYYQYRKMEVMQEANMKSVQAGNISPRMFEVYTQMDKALSDLSKQISEFQISIKDNYAKIKFDAIDDLPAAGLSSGNSEDSKLITGNVFKNTKELNMAMMEQRKRLMIQKTQEVKFEEVKEGESWFPLLMNTVGKRTSLLIRGNGRKGEEREIFVKPVSSERSLMYKRWVKRCERITAEESDGRIGYTHVQGMDSPSFREVYSTLLGRYRTADAAVVDTRNNGGGWLHDDLVTFLGGKEYIRFTPRGQYVGLEPFSKWTKPSCVLVCENNYSDASGFPYAYRTLGLGKLVGMPVPGTMTAVWWETQINGMVFGIPQVGSWAVKEDRYLENMQLEPDVRVENDPASLLSGKDRQLEAAVRLLME